MAPRSGRSELGAKSTVRWKEHGPAGSPGWKLKLALGQNRRGGGPAFSGLTLNSALGRMYDPKRGCDSVKTLTLLPLFPTVDGNHWFSRVALI